MIFTKIIRGFIRAEQRSLTTEIIESVLGDKPNTFRSVLLSIEGVECDQLIQRWLGTIQWICQSPYRPHHKRKNWFFGVTCLANPMELNDNTIEFTTMKSSGAGGQHVNKTESAVRATHLATGISVKVQTERSQHANKRLAKLLLAHKLAEYAAEQTQQQKNIRQQFHYSILRGNSQLVFYGEKFQQRKD